jgi:dimethylargininase
VTHIDRIPMDVDLAFAQYAGYLAVLERHGVELVQAPAADGHPDGLFVEDALVVVDGLAIVTRPGASSRRGEIDSIRPLVESLGLPIAAIEAPGTLDGGDVLCVGRHVFIGLTTRTTAPAIKQFATIVAPLGRTVVAVDVPGCLHLKSAITALPDGSLIAVPGWVDESVFEQLGYRVHAAGEVSGGDVLCLGNTVVLPADAPRTAQLIVDLGFDVDPVEVGELQKIEAGVTCMSVLLDA